MQPFTPQLRIISPPVRVARMIRIERPAIDADVGAESVQLDVTLRGIVARLAKRLKRPEPKYIHVATMRLDVVADGRRRDDAALEAELAQRMLEQLMPANPRPAGGAVPAVPPRTLTTNTHSSTR